jgi:phage gpG-like protein
MGSGVRGIGQLVALERKFARLAAPGFRRELYTELKNEAELQIAEGFDEQRDPYGNAWAPTKDRRSPILERSGDLRDGFTVVVTGTGLRIRNAMPYAGVHQFGDPDRGIPARPMVPVERRGLGRIWREAFYTRARALLERTLGRR